MAENLTEVPAENEDEIDVVELKADDGKILKFFHIGTMEHKEKWYAFFQPAEEMEGVEPEEVVIFEIVGEDGDESLAPVEDEALLDEVYEAFVAEMECDDCDCDDCADDDCDCDDDCHHHHHDGGDCGCGHKH